MTHIRFPVTDLCQICRRAAFCTKWRSDQSTKSGVEDHQLLCRQAGEGQPRALPHHSWRRGGRASTTGRPSRLYGCKATHWLDRLKADRQKAVTRSRKTVKPFSSVSGRATLKPYIKNQITAQNHSGTKVPKRGQPRGGGLPVHYDYSAGWRAGASDFLVWH